VIDFNKEQAEAWQSICRLLDSLCGENWVFSKNTSAVECAKNEIRGFYDRAIAEEAKLAEIEKKSPAVEDITSQRWSKEAEFFGSEPQKRIGDIHIGGEILPEFKNA